MPPLIYDFEAWIYFTKPMFTVGWLALEAILLAIPIWFVGCRIGCSGTFALGKSGKANAANLLRRWAYHRPRFLRVIQSPANFWAAVTLAGVLSFHLAVLFPSAGARAWFFVKEAHQVSTDQDPIPVQRFKLQRLEGWQLPWLNAAKFEVKWGQPLWWTPFPKVWIPGQGDAATEAAAIIHQSHMVELGGLLASLFGLTFGFMVWSREATGERHHGRAGWASRAEVACVTGRGSGYFKIPMQVSQDGSRQWERTFNAPFTVLAPSAKSNCGHGLIIGPTGSGKGAFTFGHIFATATVPICYQDSKGETPAWRMRPEMIRFGIPANKPKGLPSMRHNPISEIHREDLTPNQRADRARVLASLLLPTPAEKNANSWINETAQPLLAMGLLQGRWAHLGELADEIEGHPLPYLLSCLSVAAGRVFSLAGKNVMEYASNELANNTVPYLRGWARHAFSATDFTMADFWKRGAYIMSATESPREKLPINLFWSLVWNDAQASDKPLPCLVLLDECVAAGKIPGIVSATVKLRDRGFSIWMAFQTYAGITQVYGKDEGEALRRALVNMVILTNGLDPKDAALDS
jgi:type IV secretory pathway TraG/TraD family ATPase VirD4